MAPTALETALSQSQPAFNPTLDEETVRNYINIYKKGEEQLSKEDLALLEKHANFYKIPFALSEVDNDGSIKGMIGQLGSGFVSGFSTFNVGDPPKGTWEGIARNVGHLAGFVGFVPIPMKLAKLSKLAMGLKKQQGKFSIPMRIAGAATKKAEKIAGRIMTKTAIGARTEATSTAVGFLNTKVAKDIITGGFHLGVASAVSSWQGGVDEMIKSFVHGAETGAVFRGIGNLIQTGDLMGDKILRGLASSAYTGLPSSMRGDTTPEQVYQYLLGAYFGVKEMPYHKRSGLQHLAKMHKKGKIYPEEVKGWEELDETTQKWTKEEADRTFDKIGANALAFRLAQTGELDVVEAQKLAEEYIANRAKYTSEGEEISPLSAKLVEGRENAAVISAVEENRGEESTLDYSLDNTDIGAAIEKGMFFSKRTENWVKRNLEQVWNKPDVEPDTEKARALLSFDIENQWLSMVKTARKEGTPNPSDEMIGWLRSTYGADVDQTGKNFWRQSGERMLKSRHVPMLTTFNGELHELGKRDKEGERNHLNAAGNRKSLREEPKLIDEVHANATIRNGEESSDRAYMILDHAVVTIPNRGNVELELIVLADHFYREAQDQLISEKGTEDYYTLVKGLALRKFQDYHANNFKAMDERGYFYYGGKGDAGRQYFVKYHPETAGKVTSLDKQISKIRKVFEQHGITRYAFNKAFKEDMSEWNEALGAETKGEHQRMSDMFKRAYISNVLYELELNGYSTDFNNLKTVLKDGFINSAKAFNKRQQIWFTSGFSSNPEFIRSFKGENNKAIDDLSNQGGWNVALIKDDAELLWGDGAIYGRSDAIDAQNADWGMPSEGGAHKSFIVSSLDGAAPTNKGAILGKYMVHTASEPLQKFMKKKHIHFLIPESSAKQYGVRNLGTLKWVNGKPTLIGTVENLPIESFKGVFSDKVDSHSIDVQRVPKQMMSNLTPFAYKRIGERVIDDMYNTLSQTEFNGDAEYNELLAQYLRSPSDNKDMLPGLIKNIDNIGIRPLLDAIKQPGAEGFANAAYASIQKINTNIINEMVAAGEMSYSESQNPNVEISQHSLVHDRMMRYSGESIASVLHKYARDYRMATMRNYVVHRLTRPRVHNSFSARMRPFDLGLRHQKNTMQLKKKGGENIFFLDNGYRDMVIRSEELWGNKKKTLGEIWDEYNSSSKSFGNLRPQVKELLRTTIVRIPMDSLSGAHVLEFKGFTGVRGYGVLVHPKTVEALAGADFDGDKAFGFFGDSKYGFKKSWKDMYANQKNEFGGEPTKKVKAEFRSTFTTTPTGKSDAEKLKQAIREQVLQYSPQRRRFFSEAASSGRELLGPAVVNRATISAAYSAARASKNGYYEYEIELRKPWIPTGKGTRAIIRMIPRGNTKKERETALAKFRRLARAAVAFSSDPMDEAGLKSRDVFYQNLVDSVFTWEVYTQRGKSKRYLLDREVSKEFNSDPMGHQVRHKRMGLTGKFSDINSALYGKNRREGRRWTFQEIREKLDNATNPIDGIPEESQNTFLAKLATDLKGVDWSDDIFKRIYDSEAAEKGNDPFHRLKKLYDEFHSSLGQYEWLREALGRGTLASPRGQYIDLVIKHKLWDETFLKEQLDPANENYKENILSGKQFSRITKTRAENNFKYNEKDLELREQDLRTVVRMAEDFIVNDLSDMASVVRLAEIAEGMDPAKIYDIFKFAERLKQESYLMAKDRSKIPEEDALKTPEDRQIAEGFAKEYFGEAGVSALSDQIRINYMIRKKKYGDPKVPEDRRVSLNKQEQDLLDAFLLGSINRGRHKTVEKMEKAVDQMIKTGEYNGQKVDNIDGMINILDSYKKNIDNTSTSRLGLASDAVSENSVRKYMEHYERLFNKTARVPDKKTQDRVLKEAEVADRPQPLFDRDGKRIKGSAIEASDYDETTQQYLDEYAPFVGLKNKPLSGEPAELYAEIRDHLEFYQNSVGRKLNGLVRGLFNKDLNEMNLEDFRNLNRFFKETRTGTWYQRLFQKVSKDKGPELSGWFYHMFPEAIHRNLLRYEMDLMEVRRPYKDKFGNEITGRAEVPTSTIDKLENITHAAQEQSIQAYEEEKKIFRDRLIPYLEGVEDGNALYEMAVQTRQRYLKPRDENRSYEEAYRNSAKELDWKTLRGKKYRVILGKESKVMTGEEIVESINEIITKQNEVTKRWLKGDEGRIQEYLSLDNNTMAGLHKLRNKFIKDMEAAARDGTKIDLGLGVDGIQKISKRVLMSLTNDLGKSEKIRTNFTLDPTQFLPTKQYYPHIFGNRKIAMKERNKYIQKIMNDPTLTKEERGQQVRETVIHFHQMTGDWIPMDQMGEAYDAVEKAYSEIAAGKKKKDSTLTFFQANKRARSQFHRKAHFPGWKANVEAYESYMKNIIDTYYRSISQIGARSAIMEFRSGHLKKHGDVDLTNAWGNFYNLYARQAMGFPSKIPQHVIDNPSMKLKGTPYAWVSDSAVLGKLNRMRKWLGVKEDAKLPEELQGFDFQQMAHWGNLEAKYELASLLAHPKSAIANLYGGTVHTLISTGYSNLKNARNFAYLKTNVNPEWESMEDVEGFVQRQGVHEEFMVYEAGLSPELKGAKWDKFFREARKKINKDPEMDDKSLYSLAEEHGLSKSIFDKAAWFMRRPERTLRRDAFMAHYLQAREKFGVAIRQFDHPYLIQMAKRGVKATQFLYSAPHRPMFAATALGKVWTRFQLWSWNAVAFRNQVIRDASRFGWREGTAEFERFQRLATADLFMLSLASVFMYSLFEMALPAPWNWFQDTAELMFGDDKERERAFFGAYPHPLQPLQMVTPPALRMLPPLFKGIVTDDYAKLSNYYIYTMFPFGRMIKDVVGPGGVLENPMYGVEKISGLPYVQFARQSKKEKEKKQRYPRGIL